MTHDQLVAHVARAMTTVTPNATDLRLARAALAAIREAAGVTAGDMLGAARRISARLPMTGEEDVERRDAAVAALLRALAGEAGR